MSRLRSIARHGVNPLRLFVRNSCALDAGRSLGYTMKAVAKIIAISLMLAMTGVVATMPLTARTCILSNVASEKACKPGCCANKKCCQTSAKNTATPSQPLAKADSNEQLSATCFVALALALPTCQAAIEQFRFEAAAPPANSPPRLAFLCTFLI